MKFKGLAKVSGNPNVLVCLFVSTPTRPTTTTNTTSTPKLQTLWNKSREDDVCPHVHGIVTIVLICDKLWQQYSICQYIWHDLRMWGLLGRHARQHKPSCTKDFSWFQFGCNWQGTRHQWMACPRQRCSSRRHICGRVLVKLLGIPWNSGINPIPTLVLHKLVQSRLSLSLQINAAALLKSLSALGWESTTWVISMTWILWVDPTAASAWGWRYLLVRSTAGQWMHQARCVARDGNGEAWSTPQRVPTDCTETLTDLAKRSLTEILLRDLL